MHDSPEAAFLRKIAESYDDNTARLVYSDWLEENGQAARAEFIRVQCEMASEASEAKTDATTGWRGWLKIFTPAKPEEKPAPTPLQLRERELLEANRRDWIAEYGLPLDDVSFDRGLISQMRLSKWDGGRILQPTYQCRFATLTELDLSRLELTDADVTTFAEQAEFPALRKLILSNNLITNAGAEALASAKGLPNLETLYLFGNSVSNGDVLRRSANFKLQTLDLGEPAVGYSLSRGQAEVVRREYLREHIRPFVARYFDQYPLLQSAMLCVAQYWNDEANDAVHSYLILSELFVPTLQGVNDYGDTSVDPNIPNTPLKRIYGDGYSSSVFVGWEQRWDDNNRAIPLWAAFAPEGGSQEYSQMSEVYAPAVLFYRHGGCEILPMIRPQLDGVQSEWGAEGIGEE